MKNKLIYKPFNTVFFGSIAAYSTILHFLLKFIKGKPLGVQRAFVCLFYIFSLFVFLAYKIAISKDTYYNNLLGFDKFNWLNELPLNVCNIVLLFMPVGVFINSRILLSICFFASLILSPMALIMPRQGFAGYSVTTPRVLGYLLTHFMAISAGVMLIYFNIYLPVASDLLPSFIITALISFIIYLINKFFRKTGLNPKSNYFFSVDTEGIPAFEICYKLIPYEFLYTLPVLAVYAILASVITIFINM